MAAYIGNKRFQLTTALNGLGGPAKWGEITGQISAQADLQQEFQEVSALIMTEGIQQLNGIVKNGKMTIYQGNVEKGQFSANQNSDLSIFLDPPSPGGGSGDYVPLSTDIAGNKTAATIGTRSNGVLFPNRPKPKQLSAIGANTFTVGTDCAALSANSFAQGFNSVALGKNSIALGNNAIADYDNAFIWCGNTIGSRPIESVNEGTFCISNPAKNPEDIIYVNNQRLVDLISSGDDIYCKYGLTSEDPPGWFFMSIINGQTYIDYSQINNITNNSSKTSKIVGYFEIT